MIDDDEVDQFMNDVFEKMNLTGKIIMTLKENSIYWNKFANKIENYSFGIFVAIDNEIKNLTNVNDAKFHD